MTTTTWFLALVAVALRAAPSCDGGFGLHLANLSLAFSPFFELLAAVDGLVGVLHGARSAPPAECPSRRRGRSAGRFRGRCRRRDPD